jgi:hypothetical protein
MKDHGFGGMELAQLKFKMKQKIKREEKEKKFGTVVVSLATNRKARIRDHCRKTSVSICHRCLINTGIEKGRTFKYRLEL